MNFFRNASWADVRPKLSVLIPFLRDDPSSLLNALASEFEQENGQVEILVLDDGTCDDDLTERLSSLITSLPVAACLATSPVNIGRARGRNQLANLARGESYLFLDADMLPDSSHFLHDWIALQVQSNPAAAFGGFSLLKAPNDPVFAVHRSMAAKSDCIPASVRTNQPEKHLFTSNLMIRADVFLANRFDEEFVGWGWEDVEWAMRVVSQHDVVHPDIPASHTGLDTVEVLMGKYRQSAPNFARMSALHPAIISTYPSHKAALWIGRTTRSDWVAQVAAKIALSETVPVPARGLALRFYRAALYAQALHAQ